MKKQKKILLIAILIIVLFIGIGYAAVSTQKLIINPTATATVSEFKFYFNDTAVATTATPATATNGSTITVTAPTPTKGDTTATLTINGFHEQGDSATAKYELINDGDIDVSTVTVKITGPDGVEHTVSSDGEEIVCGSLTVSFSMSPYESIKPGVKPTVNIKFTLNSRVETDTAAAFVITMTGTPAAV